MAEEAAVQQPVAEPAAETTNMMSPTGDLVSVSNEQVQAALHPVNGYKVATPEDVSAYQNEQKYGGVGNALQAGVESAVRTGTFGTIPGFGKAEDIRGREEAHPVADVIGGVAPYLIPGAGEAVAAEEGASALSNVARIATTVPRAITEAGNAITQASGLTGVSAKALTYAAEGAIMQGQNETSKMLLKDPEASVPHALVNEGLAALFGGALGATVGGVGKVGSLWASKFGEKATDSVISKEGIPVAEKELQSGIEIPASMHGALGGDQDSYNKFQVIQKSDGYAANSLAKDVDSVYDQAQNKTLETLGADSNLIEKAPNNHAAGSMIVDAIKEGIEDGKKLYSPIYEELRPKYKGMPVTANQKAIFAGKLTSALSEQGLGALEGSAEKSTIGNLFKSLDNIESAEGIKNLNTGLNNAARNPELQRLAAVAGPMIKEFESAVVQNHLTATNAADLLARRKVADTAFKEAMSIMTELKQAIGLGRFKGTNGFIRALDEKAPEQVLQRLSNKNRQDMVQMLQTKFPKAAAALKDYHLNDMLHDAKLPDGNLNTKKFLNSLLDGNKNPQHIQDLITGGQIPQQRLSAIKDILNAIPKDGNPSNSAGMLNKLWEGKLGTIMGGVMGIGGGHIPGAILGATSEKALSEIKPFISYKILQMRGAGKEIVPSQVKAVMDYAKSVAIGRSAVNKAVNGIFNQSTIVPLAKVPTQKDRSKLDRYTASIAQNPSILQDTAKDLQNHMPDHASSLGMAAASASKYLQSIKPRTPIGLPFDTKVKPSAAEMGDYNRQLNIAQQPLMILQHIKDGTLSPKDIITLQNCHPGLMPILQQKIMDQTANSNIRIPYGTKLSMSLFLGQPMDSTMTPQAIMAAQPVPKGAPQQPGQAPVSGKHSMNALNKLPKMYGTSSQNAEKDRAGRQSE